MLQPAFSPNSENGHATQHFAWSTHEEIQKILLRQRGGRRRIPAGEFPAYTDILTYKLATGLG
jgi:hypothetical protein